MNSEEARFILSAVRPGQLDDSDPNIAAARELMESDAELRDWYQESCEFDRIIGEKFQEIDPPKDLQASILAGVRVSQTPAWKRRPFLAGLAAAAVVMVGVFFRPAVDSGSGKATIAVGTVEDFQSDMIETIRSLSGLDFFSGDPDALMAWLTEHGQSINTTVPAEMVGNPLTGCKVLDWKGSQVTLICFDNPDASKPALHLVVADASLIDGLEDGVARREQVAEWSSDVWRDGDRVYFVAARGETRSPRDIVPFG